MVINKINEIEWSNYICSSCVYMPHAQDSRYKWCYYLPDHIPEEQEAKYRKLINKKTYKNKKCEHFKLTYAKRMGCK